MKNNEIRVRVHNEMFENVVATTGNQEQLERLEEARKGKEEITFFQGNPVKMCYPYK